MAMPALDANIQELNHQHAALQVALYRVDRLLRAGEGRIVLKSAMSDLEQAFLSHFSMEEELMQQTGYSGYARHRSEHLQFILDYFILLKLDFRQEGVLDLKSMKEWFLEHLDQHDGPLESFLSSCAREEPEEASHGLMDFPQPVRI